MTTGMSSRSLMMELVPMPQRGAGSIPLGAPTQRCMVGVGLSWAEGTASEVELMYVVSVIWAGE